MEVITLAATKTTTPALGLLGLVSVLWRVAMAVLVTPMLIVRLCVVYPAVMKHALSSI
jgi:hypothetical protein